MDGRVRLYGDDGTCLVRDNLLVAFFGKHPFAEMVEGTAYCVDRFLKMVPNGLLSWSIIGGTASIHKPLTDKDLTRCRSMLTPRIAKLKNVHFRLMGPEKYGPDYSLVVDGKVAPSKAGFLDQTNVIELRFPTEFLSTAGEDAFVETVLDLCEKLRCDSGYAAVSLCADDETRYDKAGAYLAPLALRSHGFDIPDSLYAGAALGSRCRGARWLTWLSIRMIEQLGGIIAVKDKLLDGVEVVDARLGVLLRAGRTPEIGDVNRHQRTPLLTSVAHAIEPVTFFGDNGLLPLFGNDPARRDRWERRFWWQA